MLYLERFTFRKVSQDIGRQPIKALFGDIVREGLTVIGVFLKGTTPTC